MFLLCQVYLETMLGKKISISNTMAYAENCLHGIQKVLNYHSNRTYDDKVSYFQQGIFIFRYLFNIL